MKTRWATIGIIFILLVPKTVAQQHQRTDLQGNRYEWSEHELVKKNAAGTPLFTWQNPSGGKIGWVDPSDAFRILIFSYQTNEVLWLNNKLSIIGNPVNLMDLGVTKPLGICSAKDGGVWILDGATFRLIKMDERLKKEQETPTRIPALTKDDPVVQMLVWKEYLIMLIPEKSLWVADRYGQLIKKLPSQATHLDDSPAGIILHYPNEQKIWQPDTGTFVPFIKKP